MLPAGASQPEGVLLVHDRDEIRGVMWDLVGIVRSDERLAVAEARLRQIALHVNGLWAGSRPDPDLVELRNLIQCALLVVRCALQRKESRGLHHNLDHPFRDNERQLRDTIVVR